MSELDDDLRRIGVDPARLDPAVRDALRSARPDPDPRTEWLARLLDPPPPPAPVVDDDPPPPGNVVRGEGHSAQPPRVDPRTAAMRQLLGRDPETGFDL
jgi:hypothetical protein